MSSIELRRAMSSTAVLSVPTRPCFVCQRRHQRQRHVAASAGLGSGGNPGQAIKRQLSNTADSVKHRRVNISCMRVVVFNVLT